MVLSSDPKTSDYHCSPGRIHCRLVSPSAPSSRRQIACQWHRCNSSSRLLSFSSCLAVNPMCFLRVRCVRYKFCLDDAAGRREVQPMILSKSSNDAQILNQTTHSKTACDLTCSDSHIRLIILELHRISFTSHHFPSRLPPHFPYPCSR